MNLYWFMTFQSQHIQCYRAGLSFEAEFIKQFMFSKESHCNIPQHVRRDSFETETL